MSFKDIALPLAARGIPVIPVQPLSKETYLRGGEERGTTDPAKIMQWDTENTTYNVGCLGTPSGIVILDCDVKGLAARIETECSKKLPKTLIVQSAGKGCAHLYFRQTEGSRRLGNKRGDGLFDLRSVNHYVVGPGSKLRNSGGFVTEYKIWRDAPIADFPDWLEPWIIANSSSKANANTGEVDTDSYIRLRKAYQANLNPEDMFGLADLTIESLHPTLHSLACLLHDGKRNEDEVVDILERIAGEYGHRDARGRSELEGIVEHAFKKAACEFTLDESHPALESKWTEGLQIFGTEEAYLQHLKTKPPDGFRFQKVAGRVREYVLMPREKFDGWFGRGRLSLVGGSSGAGKTTLICDLLNRQRVKNTQILGHAGAGLRPLVIFADRGELSNAETFDRLGLTDSGLCIGHLPISWDGEAVTEILRLIEEQSPLPEVVFVEGADALVSDANKTQVVAPFLSGLQRVAAHYHIAMVLSVGAPKAKPKEQHTLKRDRIFGSQIWPRMSDTILTLEAVGDGTSGQRDLTVQHRNAASEAFGLEFRGGKLEERAPDTASFDPLEIWLSNQDRDRWITRPEILSAMKADMTPKMIRSRLDALQNRGKIEHRWTQGRGMEFRFKHPPESTDSAELREALSDVF